MHGVWPANLIKRHSMFYCLAECDRPWLTTMFPGSPEHRACCLLFCKLAQLRAGITRNRGTAPPPLKERFGDCDLYCRNLFAIIIQAEMRCWGGYPDEMPPILKWWINIVTENQNRCDWIVSELRLGGHVIPQLRAGVAERTVIEPHKARFFAKFSAQRAPASIDMKGGKEGRKGEEWFTPPAAPFSSS